MGVYIDDYNARFRGMIMCHMTADTLDELFEMADKIGLARRWCHNGTHFDVCLSKKRLAIKNGAIETDVRTATRISMGLLGELRRRKNAG